MKLCLHCLAFGLLPLSATHCANSENSGKPPVATTPAPKEPRLIGRIATVPANQNFVLIQKYGPWSGEINQVLTTRGPGNRVSNLRLTGEKLGDFAAADVQSGAVEVGDAVYHLPIVPAASVANPSAAGVGPDPQPLPTPPAADL